MNHHAQAATLVRYHLDTTLAACLLIAHDDPEAALVVDTASAAELRRAALVLASWMTHFIASVPAASVAGFVAGARADAQHVIDTAGQCPCPKCRAGRRDLARTSKECP